MIEKDFKDRVPTYPGRVKLIPVSGQANTYDMVRADSPTVEGTPLDKVTFESVVHSRLTGRYYILTAQKKTKSSQDVAANPIPASGWLNATKTTASLNGYEIYSSAAAASSELITAAFDGNPNTFWTGINSAECYIGFKLPDAMNVSRIKMRFRFSSGNTNGAKVQASNNRANWVDVSDSFSVGSEGGMIEVSVSAKAPYLYYRVLLDIQLDTIIYCHGLELSAYKVTTYANEFTVDNVPVEWTQGQRITVQTQASLTTLGVISNTLNGIEVSSILQPGRYYELIREGTLFLAKEV